MRACVLVLLQQEATSGENVFNSYHGGVRAAIVEGPEVYFLGIVDILQTWNTKKKLERFWKTRFRCKDGHGEPAL